MNLTRKNAGQSPNYLKFSRNIILPAFNIRPVVVRTINYRSNFSRCIEVRASHKSRAGGTNNKMFFMAFFPKNINRRLKTVTF